MKKTLCFILLICFAGSALVWAGDARQKYRATGMATVHNNYVDIARDKALDNALRNVVERAAGVMITGSTEVDNFQLKMDSILSESKGFLETYKILSEKREGDNYEVTIEAEVGTGKLQERLKAVDLIMSRKSKPRLLIVFSETAQKDALAEAAMSKFFLAKGFKLVDAMAVKKSLHELKDAVSATDEKALTKLTRNYGAEIVLSASVEAVSNATTLFGVELCTNKANVCVKVINGDTGEVITTGCESKTGPGAKGDVACTVEEATIKLSRRILDETLERWSTDLSNTTSVKLTVSGLSGYQELQNFKDQLPLVVKGFKGLLQRAYAGGAVELDLEVRGDVHGIADDLTQITEAGRTLRIMAITQNMISATFLP